MSTVPWGTDIVEDLLVEGGVAYDKIRSSELVSTDLTRYRVVIVPSDQYTSTYQALNARAAALEAFVSQGGTLEFHPS